MGCGSSVAAVSPKDSGPAAIPIEPYFSTSKATDQAEIIVPMLSSTLFDMYMSKGDLHTFAQFFNVAKFPPGTQMFVHGQPLTAFFVIVSGEVRVDVMRNVEEGKSPSMTPAGGHGDETTPFPGAKPKNFKSAAGSPAKLPATASSQDKHLAVPTSSNAGPPSANSGPPVAVFLCDKTKGEFLNSALIAGQRVCNTSATATTEVTCLVLTKPQLEKYLQGHLKMQRVLQNATGFSTEHSLERLDFLKGPGLDSAKVKLLMSMFTYVPLAEGSYIFKEGDLDRTDGNSLYLVYDGQVEVAAKGDKDKETVLATLDPGTFFGEVGLMMDIPRTASVQAKGGAAKLLALSSKEFRNFCMMVPEVLQKFNEKLARYTIALRYFIYNPIVLQYFIKHCEAEYSSENINFWMAVRDFKTGMAGGAPTGDNEAKATAIVSDYIAQDGKTPINLRSDTQKKITAAVQAGNITIDVFNAAEDEIMSLMSADSFSRFKSSPLFGACLDAANSPHTEILRRLFLI